MKDEDKTKEQLINELTELRQRTAELEASATECGQTEEVLRESEEFSSTLLENSPTPIVVLNPDSSIEYVNPMLEELTGYTSTEVIGRKAPYPWWTEDPESRNVSEREKDIRAGVCGLEKLFRKKNGEQFWVELTSTPITRNGEFKYALTNWVEITARKGAEDALQKKNHDIAERVKELNCLYGISDLVDKKDISLEEILQEVVDFIPPACQYPEITCARIVMDNQELWTENFKETNWKQSRDIIVRGERIGVIEVCYLEEKPKSDDGLFLKEEQSLINAIGQRLGLIIERKRAQEELSVVYDALNSSVNGVIITNLEGRITYVNPAFLRIFGYTEKTEVLGKNAADLFTGEEVKRFADVKAIINETRGET